MNRYIPLALCLSSSLYAGIVQQSIQKVGASNPNKEMVDKAKKKNIRLRDYDIVGGMGTPKNPHLLQKKPKGDIIVIDNKYYRIIEDDSYDHYSRMKAKTEVFDLNYRELNNEYMMNPTPEKARALIEYEKREFVDPIDRGPAYEIWEREWEEIYPPELKAKDELKRHAYAREARMDVVSPEWKYDLKHEDSEKRYLIVFLPSITSPVGYRFGSTIQKLYEQLGAEDNEKAKFVGFVVGGENGGSQRWHLYQRRFAPRIKFDMFEDKGQVEQILKQEVFSGQGDYKEYEETEKYEKENHVFVYFIDRKEERMGRLKIDRSTEQDLKRLERIYKSFVK